MKMDWKNDPKFAQSLRNLTQAFQQLQTFLKTPVEDNRARAGVIQAFEFTYDLFWKTFQKAAQAQKINVHSPIQSFQAALQMGLIEGQEEQTWLAIADDRNRSVHTYHGDFAREMFERIKNTYLPTFEACFSRLSRK